MIATVFAAALAQAASSLAATPVAGPDYGDAATWLCRPGHADACAGNQDVTVIAADGSRTIETFKPAAAPTFDCFYVYPTVSNDAGPNSDMVAGPEENLVAAAQVGRFTAQCRVFAPLYRQVTLGALRQAMTTGVPTGDRAMAYGDVKAAWDSYLARDNRGRGVILIGHSQGAGVLKQLIAREIEGKPVQQRVIAAYLAGTVVVDGDLKVMPPCRSDSQTGCVVAWTSFRADAPPPATSRFANQDGKPAWCANAAALGGGNVISRAIFTTRGASPSNPAPPLWSKVGGPVTTPFVAVPGLISTECRMAGGTGYLSVTVNADPADPRTDTIDGDVLVAGHALPDWGLHLVDMPLVMGDLIDLSGKQAAAWTKRRPAARPAR